MNTRDHKSVLGRYLQLMTRGPLDELPSIVAQDVTGYDGNERVSGVAAVIRHARDSQAGCPDLHVEVEHIIEDGEWIAFFGVTSGHHTGDLFGMAMARIHDGKIAEIRTGWDTLSVAHQLGSVAPSPMSNRVTNE